MYLFRQIKESDIDAVYQLAMSAHSGITSLPKDHRLIKEKTEWSLARSQKNALYFFGLEELETKKLVGVSAIKTNAQSKYPFNHYKITPDKRPKQVRLKLQETSLIVPQKVLEPFSELCSLFLERKERHLGLGRLLSLARFLYIKINRALFNKELKASLRGVFDEQDRSPFWENVGRRFVDLSYEDFVGLVRADPSLLRSVIPSNPQTIELLHHEARAVIGVTHKNTHAAGHLLQDQGLYFADEIDLLDGGPILKGEIDALNPLLDTVVTEVFKIEKLGEEANALVASVDAPFRAVMGNAYKDERGLTIDANIAGALMLDGGSPVLYLNLRRL